VEYTKKLLDEIGLGAGRLEMYEIAASDAPKWVAAVRQMTERVRDMGPNPLKGGRVETRQADGAKISEPMVEA
jgi:F420-non-reducing hydrogenase iron-sulfur subunit